MRAPRGNFASVSPRCDIERITRIFALKYDSDAADVRQLSRNVLHAVNGKVGAPIEQRVFKLLGKNAFDADLIGRSGGETGRRMS